MTENLQVAEASRLTFRKGERLRHRTLVNDLYAQGESLFCYPLRLTWRPVDAETLQASFRDHTPGGIDTVQVMFTVPKRKMRHAVDRVQLRRRMREAYRLKRLPLIADSAAAPYATVSLAFVYIADKKCPYTKIESAMTRLLRQVSQALEATFAD